MSEANSWQEYRMLVVSELERLNDSIEGLRKDMQKVDRDVLTLKMKASFWGAVAGFVLSLIPTIFRFINAH